MAVYDTQGRPVIVDIETAYTAGVMGVGVSTLGNTAGNTGTSTGTVVLAGTNNITVNQSTGAGGATIWIDQTGGAAADGVNIVSLSGNTAGTLTTQSTGTVVLAGGANITLSQSSNSISIVGGAGGGAAISAGTVSQNTGTVIFSNASGVSFGLDAGTLTASVKTDYLTTAAASNHTHDYAGTNGAITGGSITVNTSGVSVALPAYLTTARASNDAVGLNTAATQVTWTVNSSGISLNAGAYLTTAAQSNQVVNSLNGSVGQISLATGSSLSSSQNGSTITFGLASNITTALQSAGAYLTTAANSTHTHGSGPSITGPISVTSNSGAWSISVSNYITTARASNDAIGLNTAATQVTWTVNSSGISLNAGAYLTTAMASNASTNFAGVGETTGTTTGTDLKVTVDTAGVNVSFPKWLTTAMASDAGSAFMSTSERGNYFYTSNNTFANQTHSHGNPTLALTNLTGTTASASNGLTISLSANPAGGADGYNIVSASGNTSGTLTSFTTGTIVLAGGNNITLSQSSNSITISGANLGGAQTGISGIGASNSTYTSGTVILSGQNNVTVGTSVDGASQYVRLSVGNYLTTAAASDHSHGNPTLALTNLTGTTASGSNGLTLSISAGNYLTTAAASDHTHSQYAGTAGAITGGSITVNTSGVSVALPAYLTTAAASNHSHSLNEILDPSADKVFQVGTNHLQFQYAGGGTFSTNATRQGLFEIDANVALTDGADVVHIHNTVAPAVMDMVHVIGAGTGVTLLRLDAGASVAAEINAPLKFTGGSVPLVLGTSQSNLVANLNANYLQGKVSSEFQSTGAYLTTAAQVSHSHGNPTLALTNLTGTTASASNGLTLSLSAAAPAAAQTAISGLGGSDTTYTSGTVILSGQNNLTVGTSVNGASQYLRLSVGNYITTARASNDAVGLNTAATQVTWTVNSSGISLNAGAYLTTARASNDAIGLNTAATSVTWTVNSSGISLNAGAYLTTAMASNAVTLSNIRVSAGTTSNLLSAVTFANGSGVSFGLNAGTLTATVKTDYLTTAAVSDHSHGNPTLALTNLTGTTASASNGFTLSLSAAAPGAAAITQSVGISDVTAGGATGGTSGMVTGDDIQYLFVPGSNVTMSQSVNGSSGTISIYAGAGGGGAAIGVSNTGHTAGNTGTYSSGTIVFAGSSSLTLSQSSGGAGVHTIWLQPAMSQLAAGALISLSSNGSTVSVINLLSSSAIAQDISSASAAGTLSSRFALADHAHLGVGGFGASNVGSTAGNTGTKAGTWVLAGSNSITVSAATGAGGVNTLYIQQTGGGGGGVAMGVSNTGNTAGNTGTYSTGTFVFAGSNSMTLSQSTGGGSVHTIWMLPLLSALSGGGGISLSTTGSTIVIYTV